MGRLFLACAVSLALVGCKSPENLAPAAPIVAKAAAGTIILDAISVVNTQKTLDDHLMSLITGKDCSTVRASMGDHYCEEKPEPTPSIVRTTYCYKSLANVTCYDQPVTQDTARLYGTRTDNIPITEK